MTKKDRLMKDKISPWQARKMSFEISCRAGNEHGRTAFTRDREKAVPSQRGIRGAGDEL